MRADSPMQVELASPWWQNVARVVRRELRWLREHRWEAAMLSWWPALLAILIWWIFSAGLPRGLPWVAVDHDQSGLSRQVIRFVDQAPALGLLAVTADEAQAVRLLQRGQALGMLVVPGGFERALKTGQAVHLPFFVNGQYATAAGVMQSDMLQAVSLFSAGVELQVRVAHGASPAQATQAAEPIRPGLRTLFNPSMNYEGFLVPALCAALLQMFAMIASVMLIGREIKGGTAPEWLASAQGQVSAALAGKLLVALLPLMGLAVLGLTWMGVARGFAVHGSVAWMLLAWALMCIGASALGLIAVSLSLSLRMALSVAGFITSPAFTYSGFVFPLMAMPPLAQAWALALPLTHAAEVQAQQWWMGSAPWASWPHMAVLLGWAVLPWLFARGLVKRMLKPAAWGRP